MSSTSGAPAVGDAEVLDLGQRRRAGREATRAPCGACGPCRPRPTSPVEMSRSGLIDRSDPSRAWAPPMRPPFLRFSSVSRAPSTWVRGTMPSTRATTSSALAPPAAASAATVTWVPRPDVIERESIDAHVEVVGHSRGRVAGGLDGGRQALGQVDAHDGVGARLGLAAERSLERAGGGGRGLGQRVRRRQLLVELGDGQVDAVGELLGPEPDGQRHHLDARGELPRRSAGRRRSRSRCGRAWALTLVVPRRSDVRHS